MARGMEIGEDLVGTFLRRVDDGRVEYRILGEQIAQRPRVAAARHIGVTGGAAGMLAHGSFSRSGEHTSEIQSLNRTSYCVFCLDKNTNKQAILDTTLVLL